MNGLRHFPLGDSISGSPHSVCVSLPTMADVIGYEEKDPRVIRAMKTGYPRFFEHPWVRQLKHATREGLGWPNDPVFLIGNSSALDELIAFVGENPARESRENALTAAQFKSARAQQLATAFLQHTGSGPSSRRAESILYEQGLLSHLFPEETAEIVAASPAANALVKFLGVARLEDLYLAGSGMNAFYASFRALEVALKGTGRKRWIRLGWLYVDTIRILESSMGTSEESLVWYDVEDLEGFAAHFDPLADEIAGIVTEAPTNPLVQTANLVQLRELADRWGCALIIDPTVAGTSSVNVLPMADVVVTSLTKYAVQDADVMSGAVIPNPHLRWGRAMKEFLPRFLVPLFRRDLERLGRQVVHAHAHMEQVTQSAIQICDFLHSHRRIERVHGSGTSRGSAANYRRISRAENRVAPVISIVVRGNLERFYDRLEMAKTPSFGAAFTMSCPFMYLAHYGELKTEEGRLAFKRAGIRPELVRISIGSEPPDAIIACLKAALGALD